MKKGKGAELISTKFRPCTYLFSGFIGYQKLLGIHVVNGVACQHVRNVCECQPVIHSIELGNFMSGLGPGLSHQVGNSAMHFNLDQIKA